MIPQKGGGTLNKLKFLKEALPVLTLLGIIEVLTGSVLSRSGFHGISGLIALIPALISIRGNVAGSFASRLGSMAHLGSFEPMHPLKTSKDGILAAVLLSPGLSAFIVIAAYGFALLFGVSMNFIAVLAVVVLTSITSSIVLIFLSIYSVVVSFKMGVDPDNVVTPIIATIGDFTTVFILAGYIALWEVLF